MGAGLAPPVTVINGTAQVQVTVFPVGTHQIVAEYSGDTENQASQSGALNLTITGSSLVQITGTTGSVSHLMSLNVTVQ